MRSIEFKPSFDKSFGKLHSSDQDKVDSAVGRFLSGLEKNQIPQGLGLKRLQDDQWEIRVDLSLRICFRMQKNLIEFALAGTHDSIKKFLKNF